MVEILRPQPLRGKQFQDDIGAEIVAGILVFFVGISQTDKGFHRIILPKRKEKRLQRKERVKDFLRFKLSVKW